MVRAAEAEQDLSGHTFAFVQERRAAKRCLKRRMLRTEVRRGLGGLLQPGYD